MSVGVLMFAVAVGSVFCVSLLCMVLPRALQWVAAFIVPVLLAGGCYWGLIPEGPSEVRGDYAMWAPIFLAPAVLVGIPASLIVVWLLRERKAKS